jgi:hypothetical protein
MREAALVKDKLQNKPEGNECNAKYPQHSNDYPPTP